MNKKLNWLVLAIIAVGPTHMGEQLMFGIEEFYMLREGLGGWYAMFPAAYADHATVLLITIVVTAISLMFYAVMRGGTAVLLVAGLFGVLGIGEAHHWIEAIGKRVYDPGLVTSFAYVGVGLLIAVEVVEQLKQRWRSRKPSAATA